MIVTLYRVIYIYILGMERILKFMRLTYNLAGYRCKVFIFSQNQLASLDCIKIWASLAHKIESSNRTEIDLTEIILIKLLPHSDRCIIGI